MVSMRKRFQQKLKGPKGTKVTVTIRRPGFDEPFDITITRDKIPIYSVMAKFIIKDKIGYILCGTFCADNQRRI